MYTVNSIYKTIQGEGAQTGMPIVLVRFTGCNLWSGLEDDRAQATCKFCDTDFVSGEKYTARELIIRIVREAGPVLRNALLTGGEPTLQVDDELVAGLKACGFYISIETNGTKELPNGIDWVTVSPKAGAPLKLRHGDELKVVFPQEGHNLSAFEKMDFNHFFVQPMDGPNLRANTVATVALCQQRPKWRLSVQVHKFIGIA